MSTNAVDVFSHMYAQKLTSQHRERLAIVYVRQSTLNQVQRHKESTELQYGLVGVAEQLGWPRDRIVVIDDDLGVSGSSAEDRIGFQRVLSEVALHHVGIILGIEMSRLARSCKDWYQLLELCALFDTLICDLDGLYDPTCYNDRLLLGLKGTMSEAELHILRQRMLQGLKQKARRGELILSVPIGYVQDPSGKVELDPDEQARSVVRLVFEQFSRIGTVSGLLRYLVRQRIELPVRIHAKVNRGKLEWRHPHQQTLRNMLTHPIYAGAYAYGRSCQSKTLRQRRNVPRRVPREQWEVLLKNHFPGYITWEQYERNQEQIAENRSLYTRRGTARKGRALLVGLLYCGRCGRRMQTSYSGRNNRPRYDCIIEAINYAKPLCQGLSARSLDDEVVRLALKALTPASLEVSLQIAADLKRQHADADTQWRQRIERARYESDRARRQYDAVEPENRLVARTLEMAWEKKLQEHRELEEGYDRFCQQQPRLLCPVEQSHIRRLANDLPALWNASTTTDIDRKEILRQVIDRVAVTVEGKTEWVEVMIHWSGGSKTYTRIRRSVASLEQLSTWPTLRERLREMKAKGMTSPHMAAALDREGFRAPNGRPFSKEAVRNIIFRYRLGDIRRKQVHTALGPDEWLIPNLAEHLCIPYARLYRWVRAGKVEARQIDGSFGHWVVTVDQRELKELKNKMTTSTGQARQNT